MAARERLRGHLHLTAGQSDELRQLVWQTVDQAEALMDQHGRDGRYRAEFAAAAGSLGVWLASAQEPPAADLVERAAAKLERAKGVADGLVRQAPHVPRHRQLAAEARIYLGVVHGRFRRQFPAAEAEFRAAVRMLDDLTRDHPEASAAQMSRLNAHYYHFVLHAVMPGGDPATAERGAAESLRLAREMVSRFPDSADVQHRMAIHAVHVGRVWRVAGRPDRADPSFRTACDRYQGLVRRCPEAGLFRTELARAYTLAGGTGLDTGRPTAADDFREAVALTESAGRPGPLGVAALVAGVKRLAKTDPAAADQLLARLAEAGRTDR
jgi:hypothetical protein